MVQIKMDAPTQAFYKGVAAGHEAFARVEEEKDWDTKVRNFFFFAGRASTGIPDEHLELFARGVAIGTPSEPEYVIYHVDTGQLWDGLQWIGPAIDIEDGPWPETIDHSKRADYRLPEDGFWAPHDPAKHG